MGTHKNVYDRIMKKPTAKDIMPEELRSFLKWRGFELKRVNGSHHIYGYPDYPKTFSIPMHNSKPVGPAYINMIRDIICEMEEES